MDTHFWFQYRCLLVGVGPVFPRVELLLSILEHVGLEGLTGVEHVKSILVIVLWTQGEVAGVGEEEAVEEEVVGEEAEEEEAVVEGEAVVVEEVEAEEEEVEEKKLSTYFLRRS